MKYWTYFGAISYSARSFWLGLSKIRRFNKDFTLPKLNYSIKAPYKYFIWSWRSIPCYKTMKEFSLTHLWQHQFHTLTQESFTVCLWFRFYSFLCLEYKMMNFMMISTNTFFMFVSIPPHIPCAALIGSPILN